MSKDKIKKGSAWKEFTKGLLRQNPLLVLLLGTCPALAVTTSLNNGIGMGLASTFVLIGSNVVISLIRDVIPDKVRIPSYITVIASFVTILQFLMEAYQPELNESMGIFIPLITVNCIILGRAEAFASKNTPFLSALDGLGMGLGFTAALCVIGGIREILGNGSIGGWQIPFIGGENALQPILIFIMPPGGFFIFGLVIAIALKLSASFYAKHPDEAVEAKAIRNAICDSCLSQSSCPASAQVNAEETAEVSEFETSDIPSSETVNIGEAETKESQEPEKASEEQAAQIAIEGGKQ